jgi:hypothetical protein
MTDTTPTFAKERGLELCRWEENGEVAYYWWKDKEPPEVGDASDYYPTRAAAIEALLNDTIEWM